VRQRSLGTYLWPLVIAGRTDRQGERLVGSLSAIKARAPVLGGNFGIWGGLFSSFDCAVKGYRQKEDPWNAIISGFLTGGTLALRGMFYSPSLFFASRRWHLRQDIRSFNTALESGGDGCHAVSMQC
jgi:hypothetical protein